MFKTDNESKIPVATGWTLDAVGDDGRKVGISSVYVISCVTTGSFFV